MRRIEIGRKTDFELNSVSQISVADKYIAIYRLNENEFYATNDICTHGQAYLSEGWLNEDGIVECPLHGGCFDIKTGKALALPVEIDIETYPITILGDAVFLDLE